MTGRQSQSSSVRTRGLSGPPVKCQQAENQTERVSLRQPDRREDGSDRKRKREKKGGGG